MPVLSPPRPPRAPAPTYTFAQQARGVRRIGLAVVVGLVALVALLLMLEKPINTLDDKTRQQDSTTTTIETPIADWMAKHPDVANWVQEQTGR